VPDSPLYDRIGRSYSVRRRTEPRLAAVIWDALGDARSVANVGAGAGSYEPPDRDVIAIEPSPVMIAQRPPGSAPAIQGSAESLPLGDDSVDAALVVLSDHHWSDRTAGLRELRRVARRRVVIFSFDPAEFDRMWLVRDYLPQVHDIAPPQYRTPGVWGAELADLLGGDVSIEPVLIPHDCIDGFMCAHWRHPEAYLDPDVRASISVFDRVPPAAVDEAIERLRADLESGEWQRRNADLQGLDAIDLGYRLVTAEFAAESHEVDG
jgi:SAM-dependent methyltransferase